MRTARRIAPALAFALLGVATAPGMVGAQLFGNGMNVAAANNGFGGFGPMGMGAAVGPMAMNNGNGFAFGFGGPMNGGFVMFSGGNPGMGFGAGPWFGNAALMAPPPQVANNMGGLAAAIDQQVMRRPGAALPAVRRRRR